MYAFAGNYSSSSQPHISTTTRSDIEWMEKTLHLSGEFGGCDSLRLLSSFIRQPPNQFKWQMHSRAPRFRCSGYCLPVSVGHTMHFGSTAFAFNVFVPFVEPDVSDAARLAPFEFKSYYNIFYLFRFIFFSLRDPNSAQASRDVRCNPMRSCNAKLKLNLQSPLCVSSCEPKRTAIIYRLHFPWMIITFYADSWQMLWNRYACIN